MNILTDSIVAVALLLLISYGICWMLELDKLKR
jgi:hypothetical protein